MSFLRLVCATGAAAVVTVSAGLLPASAQQAPERRIHVKTCEPTRNVTTTAPMYGPGFGPGYYGRGFYWDDPYGYPYYQRPVAVSESAQLKIDYVNVTHTVMETIDFGLIANGRLIAEVRDVGTFSPGAEIKHVFGVSPNIFPLATALPQCVPLRITYKDQATWVNPHLPALQQALYGP
jgi:hypothetical protein